jgi:hypothetical protein
VAGYIPRDGQRGNAPLTNAVAMLSVTDDQQPFTFGEPAPMRGRLPPAVSAAADARLSPARARAAAFLGSVETKPAGPSSAREFTVALHPA